MQGETTEEGSRKDHAKKRSGTGGVRQDRKHSRAPTCRAQERQCGGDAKASPRGSEALGCSSPLKGRGKALRL